MKQYEEMHLTISHNAVSAKCCRGVLFLQIFKVHILQNVHAVLLILGNRKL